MIVLFAPNRKPVVISQEAFKSLAEAVNEGKKTAIINGDIFSLNGIQTTTSIREAEDMWASRKNKYRCKFNNWHQNRIACRCDSNVPADQYISPLEEFDFYQEFKKRLLASKTQKPICEYFYKAEGVKCGIVAVEGVKYCRFHNHK